MRRVVAIVSWWLVLCGLWLLYVGQHTKENAVAGAIAAAIAVAFAALLARFGLYRFGLDRRWLARAARLPWYLLRDFVVVGAALLRGRPSGRFTTLDFPVGGDDPRSAGRRALVGLLGSITPNAYIVDFDREGGSVLLHELDSKRSKGEPL